MRAWEKLILNHPQEPHYADFIRILWKFVNFMYYFLPAKKSKSDNP